MLKIMIGGQKLKQLGHDRHTDDVDYLVYDESKEMMYKEDNVDYINAAKHPILKAVWEKFVINEEITLDGLFTLCSFAFREHLFNLNNQKADAKEYDMKFLARKMNKKVDLSILEKHFRQGELAEIKNIINEVK